MDFLYYFSLNNITFKNKFQHHKIAFTKKKSNHVNKSFIFNSYFLLILKKEMNKPQLTASHCKYFKIFFFPFQDFY